MITQIQWDPRLHTQNQQLKINLSVSWTIHRACFFTWDHFDGAPRIPTRSSFLQLDLADSNGNPILRHLCTIDLMRELCPSLMATSPFAVAATHDIIENNIGPHLPEAAISSNSSKAKTRSLRALASRYSSLQCRMNWATDFLIGHWTSGLSNAIQNNAKGSLWVSLMIRRWYDAWWWQFKATPSSRRSANSKPSEAPLHAKQSEDNQFCPCVWVWCHQTRYFQTDFFCFSTSHMGEHIANIARTNKSKVMCQRFVHSGNDVEGQPPNRTQNGWHSILPPATQSQTELLIFFIWRIIQHLISWTADILMIDWLISLRLSPWSLGK